MVLKFKSTLSSSTNNTDARISSLTGGQDTAIGFMERKSSIGAEDRESLHLVLNKLKELAEKQAQTPKGEHVKECKDEEDINGQYLALIDELDSLTNSQRAEESMRLSATQKATGLIALSIQLDTGITCFNRDIQINVVKLNQSLRQLPKMNSIETMASSRVSRECNRLQTQKLLELADTSSAITPTLSKSTQLLRDSIGLIGVELENQKSSSTNPDNLKMACEIARFTRDELFGHLVFSKERQTKTPRNNALSLIG